MKNKFLVLLSLLALITILLASLPAGVQAAGNANFSLNPSPASVNVGQTVTVNVMLDASAQQVAGFDASVKFDPAYLKETDFEPGPIVSGWVQLANRVDNTSGYVDFSYGIPVTNGTPVNTAGVIGIIKFQALQATTGTAINFSNSTANGMHETIAALAGKDVTGARTGTSITIISPTPISTTPSNTGSGGGGGGGNIPQTTTPVTVASTLTTDVPLVLDSDNKVQSTVTVTTADKDGTLLIDSGTQMKTADGQPLSTLTSKKVQPSQAPPSSNAIVMCYDFGPDGAKFVPSLTLTLKYNPADLKSGADENKLFVSWWDGKTWQSLGGIVDTKAHTIQIKVSHFSQYSVMESAPASPTAPVASAPPVTTTTAAPTSAAAQPTITPPSPPASSAVTSAPVTSASLTSPTPESPSKPANWALIIGVIVVVVIVATLAVILLIRKKV